MFLKCQFIIESGQLFAFIALHCHYLSLLYRSESRPK
jgi:hypothetical protein